jgi:hypothetical protein
MTKINFYAVTYTKYSSGYIDAWHEKDSLNLLLLLFLIPTTMTIIECFIDRNIRHNDTKENLFSNNKLLTFDIFSTELLLDDLITFQNDQTKCRGASQIMENVKHKLFCQSCRLCQFQVIFKASLTDRLFKLNSERKVTNFYTKRSLKVILINHCFINAVIRQTFSFYPSPRYEDIRINVIISKKFSSPSDNERKFFFRLSLWIKVIILWKNSHKSLLLSLLCDI